ncbi:hypothetical protein PG989_015810 [Apiospora arundinis]
MQYTHLMSRYVKHYEFSLKDDLHVRLHREDIVDLQRWRRRSNQTLHKLMLTEQFIDHKRGAEPDQALWSDVLDDYRFLTTRVEKYRSALELIIPLATAMAQIADTRKSMLEASSVKHLTLIALVFVPLAYVASVFSMSDGYAPGGPNFWVYLAFAVPLMLVIVGLSFVSKARAVRMVTWLKGFLK